jgi:hypothetical protein
MQMNEVKQRIDRIEQCTDEARQAVQSASAPPTLKQSVEQMHQQAHQAQQACSTQQQQQADDGSVRQTVAQLEQSGDRAMQACRQAGNVPPQVQQAVQRAHDEISHLKREMQMQ